MTNEQLLERLGAGILIGDGAMGTMLYSQGAFLNTCFDELCITRAAMIRNVHTSYIEAGCDFIETNSFGANELKLAQFGLGDAVESINTAAATLAREAAGDTVLAAGAVGPTGTNNPNPSRELTDTLSQAFRRQIQALADGGVDFLLLETFTTPAELQIAIEAAAKTGLAIVAQMTCTPQLETFFGTPIEKAVSLFFKLEIQHQHKCNQAQLLL